MILVDPKKLVNMNRALKNIEDAETRTLAQSFQPILEPERDLLAKEIHNGLSQNLVGASFIVSGLLKVLEKGECPSPFDLRDKISSLNSLMQLLVGSVREISNQLRPPVLVTDGLIPAIKWKCDQISRLKKVNCALSPNKQEITLSTSAANFLYRITEKLLNQSVQFGSASDLKVTVTQNFGRTKIRITDNGDTIESHSRKGSLRRLGILVANEHLEILGGCVGFKRVGDENIVEAALPQSSQDT